MDVKDKTFIVRQPHVKRWHVLLLQMCKKNTNLAVLIHNIDRITKSELIKIVKK